VLEFSGDDDGVDADGASYFYSIVLDQTASGGGVTDLMSAAQWLSPASNLTEVMLTDQESCDQSFCSTFTSTATFQSHGSADSNLYYPRYVPPLTVPFTVQAQILKNFACDDHFVVFSRLPFGSSFRYGVREDIITFAWDCNHKYLFAQGSETLGGEVRNIENYYAPGSIYKENLFS